jgi:tryptophan synthase alpha chain
MERARACRDVPLVLGLGISDPAQCRQAGELADGVVVGSALVKAAMDALEKGEDPASRCGELAGVLKAALD